MGVTTFTSVHGLRQQGQPRWPRSLMMPPTVIKRHEVWRKGVQPLKIAVTLMRTRTPQPRTTAKAM
jgi:hypothetical protein